jgi:hypothetical protein
MTTNCLTVGEAQLARKGLLLYRLSCARLVSLMLHTHLGPGDLKNIKELAEDPSALQQLGASLAPSIHGHNAIKQALVRCSRRMSLGGGA